MIIENLNTLLEHNDIQVRIGSEWYKLESISIKEGESENTMPIMVSDEDGEDHEFDMADIDEFDPVFMAFKDMDTENVGIA